MMVYVLEFAGVYRQGIIGVFSSEEIAREKAVEAIRKEDDDYHQILLEVYEVDSIYDPSSYSGRVFELATLARKDEGKWVDGEGFVISKTDLYWIDNGVPVYDTGG